MELTGRSLIEASAGTGKTYTIASLYLRYIVEQPLKCQINAENILVVTFTKAATAELRDRIRARLHNAVACFKGMPAKGDLVIEDLLNRYQDQKDLVLKRLYAAEKAMDDAAIYTIHGFCNRAIKIGSFTALNSVENNESEQQILLQATEDFWRILVYPLKDKLYKQVATALGSPAKLAANLFAKFSYKAVDIVPEPLAVNLDQLIPILAEQQISAWRYFCQKWQTEFGQCFDEIIKIPKIRKSAAEKHFQVIADWLMQDEYSIDVVAIAIAYIVNKFDKPDVKLDKCKEFIINFETLKGECDFKPHLLSYAYGWVKQRLWQEKQKIQQIAPDDFMTILNELLQDPKQGAGLAQTLAKQYPVAMIDEFQDTDALQLSIFQQIYQRSNLPETNYAWLMIGDPKQAIYSFRGGDIHTYGAAKIATNQQRWLSLNTNYRSTQGMVAAANYLFANCAGKEFLSDQISYEQVNSKETGTAKFCLNNQEQSALQLWQFDSFYNANQAAEQCAEQIVQILNAGENGQATIKNQPIKPSDLAVLVRNKNEAESIKNALRKRGVRSVFAARTSVYSSVTAIQLWQWLEAIYHYKDERLLTAALANGIIPYTAVELAKNKDDEILWQQHQLNAARYHQIWQQRGVLTAIEQWLHDYQIPANMVAHNLNGERELADLLHIAELLQTQAKKLEGQYALLGFLKTQIQNPNENSDSQKTRLESDKDLVQIATIHGSKGLEYHIVFVPFALSSKQAKNAIYPANGKQIIDFKNTSESLKKADEERLAEDLRLLYVAITRAVYVCYLGLVMHKKSSVKCALEHLLNISVDALDALPKVADFAKNSKGLVQLTLAEPKLTLLQQPVVHCQKFAAKIFNGKPDLSWEISSYSSLCRHKSHSHEVAGVSDEQELKPTKNLELEQSVVAAPQLDRFGFIKGAKAGNVLHKIFQEQEFAQGNKEQLLELTAQGLRISGITETEQWQAMVADWVWDVLQTPMPFGISLAQLPKHQTLPEMEFYLQVKNNLSAAQFNQLLSQYPLLNEAVSDLSFKQFNGLLKGFIDLTFEHNGKYFVCDYKSNHLGNSFQDYSQQAMQSAMAAHRYDAQLILYTLALHRMLKKQLQNYDYQTHVGGGYYLFLRGISQANSAETGVVALKPAQELIEKLDELLGANA